MLDKLLCRFGFHDWKRTNGVGYSRPGSDRMAIFFDMDCRRCGKHEDGVLSL